MIKRVIKQKGFTLIELLVVISIVSLLSSVILASLKSARNKASDSAIKEQMSEIRNQIELYHSTHGNYGDFDDSGINQTFSDQVSDPELGLSGCGGGYYSCLLYTSDAADDM
jgi:prepilin-type N-terminal cleavage/methylation domain-containing protein